jgi:hypothetical protein
MSIFHSRYEAYADVCKNCNDPLCPYDYKHNDWLECPRIKAYRDGMEAAKDSLKKLNKRANKS